MKITLTGASGFIGGRLVDRLLAKGHEIHVLGRRRPAGQLTFHTWDAARDSSVALAAIDGAQAVIHLAGEPVAQRWTSQAKQSIRASRVNGTQQLVKALLALKRRPEVLISASAIGFYGERGDEVLTETSKPGSGFLPSLCVEWENLAAQFGERAVQLRLGIVLGPDGGALAKMVTPFRFGVGGTIGSGRQWMSWIHVDDVVGLILFALENAKVKGPMNVTAPAPVRNTEFTKSLAAALHRPAILPVPGFALRVLFGEMSSIMTGSLRVEPMVAMRAGYQFRFAALDGALADLFD